MKTIIILLSNIFLCLQTIAQTMPKPVISHVVSFFDLQWTSSNQSVPAFSVENATTKIEADIKAHPGMELVSITTQNIAGTVSASVIRYTLVYKSVSYNESDVKRLIDDLKLTISEESKAKIEKSVAEMKQYLLQTLSETTTKVFATEYSEKLQEAILAKMKAEMQKLVQQAINEPK